MTTAIRRIAVVGAGPSGLYVTKALLAQDRHPVQIDVLDALPTPFGLVRYGVAPDHVKMKAVTRALKLALEDPRVLFLGDVRVGTDVTPETLHARYDAVVHCTGAGEERRLGIPGEDLPGSHSAGELVSWYSGHPDAGPGPDLQNHTAVVVGAGNVALDIARVLVLPEDVLRDTDVPDAVLGRFAASEVRDVHVVCRRGPDQTRFTPKELRDLGRVPGVAMVVDAADLPEPAVGTEAAHLSCLDVFAEWAGRPPSDAGRRVIWHFWTVPHRVTGAAWVEGVELSDVRPAPPAPGRTPPVVLPAGLLVRCIGYLPAAVCGLPLDAETAHVPNRAGRVVGADGEVRPGTYVAGWLKRGPTGVIGTNRPDAEETAASLLADLDTASPRLGAATGAGGLTELLGSGRATVDYDGWLAIDRAEEVEGRPAGRRRVKIADWSRLRGHASNGAPSMDVVKESGCPTS